MATTQILNYLEQIKKTVSAAERTYNREGQRVEWDSARTTSNLFGDTSAALELIVRARSITNAYYTALAGAGEALDAHCRPLLAQNPDASAIKAVADYLKYICDEISSMGTNFTASVNGRSYGNVASDRFAVPANISAARIYWQAAYDSSPAAKEAARREKQQREERARRAAAVAAEMHRSYLDGCVGKRYDVLFEQTDSAGRWTGHAPNYILVAAESAEALHNCVRSVRIVGAEGESLLGVLE